MVTPCTNDSTPTRGDARLKYPYTLPFQRITPFGMEWYYYPDPPFNARRWPYSSRPPIAFEGDRWAYDW